ncbi:MAG: sugar phosphate isomerase/epimerase [Bacteroidales bacterium]|nr:sugar phosphate isomerase/epimerase [Bacteroidales bacterium]
MDRRSFLTTSAMGTAALAAASMLPGCASSPKKLKDELPLKISFQEGIAPGENLGEKLDFMESIGVVGFEPGGRGLKGRVKEIQDALSGRNITVSAICAGFDGFILAEDPAVKNLFDTTMREIVEAAGELGSTGVIMVPAFNSQKPCMPHNQETRDYLCEELHKLGEFAKSCGTTVILEPLNRAEAFYMRLVADAAAIARDADSEGVKAMGDFWHMKEETCDYGAFMSAGKKYLQHVHIASKGDRKMPGEHPEVDNYVAGFKALKEIGYDKFVSFECGCGGDRATLVTAAVDLLNAQWAEA